MNDAKLIARARSFAAGCSEDRLVLQLAKRLEERNATIQNALDHVGHYSDCRSRCNCSEVLLDVLDITPDTHID